MKHGSLFSGIGGFDLAAEWMGWENVFHCEKKPYPQKILKQRWPNTISYGDIEQTDFTIHRGKLDVLSGGWPCQDNSRARQNKKDGRGLEGKRSGLYFGYSRAIREARPDYAVGENVPDVLTVNGGRDFNTILSDLAEMGYNATWGVLRASDIGAPHHRERLYVVAYASGIRFQTLQSLWKNVREQVEKTRARITDGAIVSIGVPWQSPSDFLRMDDDVPDRAHRIEALGNAVVPLIPYQIFKAIESYHTNHQIIQ